MHSPNREREQSQAPEIAEVDSDGFLLHPETWTHDMARMIASHNNIGTLTQKHLQIMHFLRDYYFELGAFATPHQICSELDVDRSEMKDFFGSCANAWKVAGLPNPGEEAKAYMS